MPITECYGTAGPPSRWKVNVVLGLVFLFFVQAGVAEGHPLDEVMLESYDAQAPQSMDVGVMRPEANVYKVGIFLNLNSLFGSVYVPERLRAQDGFDKTHPAWPELLRIAQRHACLLVAFYVGDERQSCSATLPEVTKSGALDPKGRDFVEMDYAVPSEATLFIVMNAGIEKGRLGLMDGPRSMKKEFGGDKSYIVSIRGDGTSALEAVPAALAKALTEGDDAWGVFRRYVGQGFVHIIPAGLDHILFILGLFLLAVRWRPLILQVSLFTFAHTLTLGMATLGLVELAPSIVEPLIAISIAWVGIENVMRDSLSRGRMGVVFCFGLLHGLGFAGVLGDLGMPKEDFVISLLGFNLGVELGQLAVISLAFLSVAAVRKRSWYRVRVVRPASVAIAVMGIFWGLERIFG